MALGFVMLCHTALHRAAEVARFWAGAGHPVVIHIDGKVPEAAAATLRQAVQGLANVSFAPRFGCEWGSWPLVRATQAAAEQLLGRHPEVDRVYLASGSCLPLRPPSELAAYLAARPGTDFIESVTATDVDWTVDGLSLERFTLRFPFSWTRRRRLFNLATDVQRALHLRRRVPEGITPHLGSQWWCLTRETLTAILNDPDRQRFERYFSRVWIPDESYFQTMVRRHSKRIESRSLTLTKFDFRGKPHVFYDDHLPLLRRSDCFVVRKVWPRADRLYQVFLAPADAAPAPSEPNPARIDKLFTQATERRTRGRPGLYMQSRFPLKGLENGLTAGPYSVFHGFSDLFEDFEGWLARVTSVTVHGHLFAPERAEFSGGVVVAPGAISDAAGLRDYNPRAFLANLIWNARGQRLCFMFAPRDNQKILPLILADPNAQFSVITGAWALLLFLRGSDAATVRAEAALLQRNETAMLAMLRRASVKARIRVWTLADFIENPAEPMQAIIDEIQPRGEPVAALPAMVDFAGFGRFLQDLKNQGMLPQVMGDFPPDDRFGGPARLQPKARLAGGGTVE